VLDKLSESQRLYVAAQAGTIAWRQLGDVERARHYFEVVQAIEPAAPALSDFAESEGSVETKQAKSKKKKRKRKKKDASDASAVAAVEEQSATESEGDEAGEQAEADSELAAAEAEATEAEATEAEAAEAEPEAAEAEPEPEPEPEPVVPDEPREEVIGDELAAAMDEARKLEEKGPEKSIDAWKKAVDMEPDKQAPRENLVRVYREAERWNQVVEALKDWEEKAAVTPSEKVHVLRQLVDVYGDHLRNEIQAINTLKQMIEIKPSELSLYDELASRYESKKRWPDLVSTLEGKAEQLPDVADKIAIYLQTANLYIDRFSNQAEEIKRFEKVLALDSENAEAIGHLMEVYEKRRDWQKLMRLKEGEINRTEDPAERTAKTYEVAKLAATRVKKPDICIVWWEKVLENEPGHEEAVNELYKLHERAKNWDAFARICQVRANIAADTKTQVDSLQKLGLLYQDKLEDTDKAIAAWRQLLDIDENHRRAADSLKKLYVAAGNYDDLEAFYRSRDKLDEFVRVLEREVDNAPDDDKLGLAMKIAVTYRDEIGKADRAMRAFEKVLSFDEENLDAAEALIPLYEKGRDPRKLFRALEIQLNHTEDPSTRQERIHRLAELAEEKMRDKALAFTWWLKAFAENHEDVSIREQLERLAEETGTWAELVDAYKASYGGSAPKFASSADALPLMSVVARVQEQELGEIDAALETNRAIYQVDDSNEAALGALERLYLGKQQFEDLLDIYKRKLDLGLEGDEQTQVQLKIAQLYEDEVKDDGKAVEAYKAILDTAGDDTSALASLDRIYVRNENWSDLADVLERQILVVGPDEEPDKHIQLKYRLGQLRESRLGDITGGFDCYRDILELDPKHSGAREALEAHLAVPTDEEGQPADSDEARAVRLAAANILEPIYEQLERWAPLIGVYEIQLAASDDKFRRVGLLMRIGELYSRKLGDADAAFDAFARCFREDPSTEGAKNELEELCGLLDDGWDKLVALFEQAINSGELDPSLSHELATKVARAQSERLGDTSKAVEYYRKALQVEPDDLNALEALEQIFTRDEQYAELLDVYRKKVDITTEPDDRLRLLFQIASIYEEMLQNADGAIETYSEILGHDADNLHALRALDRLYVAGEQWQELADNLTRQLVLCEEISEQVRLQVRLAQLRESQLGEVAAAVETYRQVLDLDPTNREAITALERLVQHEEHELTIAQILEPIYKAAGSWDMQIKVYEIMQKHAFDPERKIELLHKIAELNELGGDDGAAAFDTYARGFRQDPSHEQTAVQLERLARMFDRWRDVVSIYDEVIAGVGDDQLRTQLLTKLAQIYEIELGDDEKAVSTYERILEQQPEHLPSASAIQAIHERNANYDALVAILRRKSDMIMDVPERKQLLYKAAQIYEDILGDTEKAIATFQAVLDIDDIDMPAMDALERLYIGESRWEPLRDVYAKKADLAEDPDEKKQMLYVLGQVHDRELGDTAKAIDTYQSILDLDPDELAAIQALDRLYGQAERWYDLLQNLERQVELAESTEETVGLKYRIGKLWEDKLGDLTRAIESFRDALQLDYTHMETLVALDALMRRDDGEPVLAAKVLEPIYEAVAEFERLIDTLEVMVKHSEDPVEQVELLHRIAEYQEHRMERPHEAFDAFARALREDSGNELTVGHLERLADQTGAWAQLVELYGGQAEKSLDVPRQVDLLSRMARIQEQEMGLTDEAIATYKRIIDVEFDNRAAVLALDRLYSATERWSELSEILRKEIQFAETGEEIVMLQFRLGQVLEQALGDLPGAIEVYRDILGTDPEHTATLGALEMMFLEGQHELEIAGILEPLYETAGEFEKLHKIYEVQLSKILQQDISERLSMYQRLAELAEQRLLDANRAFSWWGAALQEDPKSELAIEEVERLAAETQSWEGLVNVYLRVLEIHTDDAESRRQTLLRMARVYEQALGDAARAVETHLLVLEIDPGDVDALAALDRLYQAAGMYDELVEILRRRIEVTLDGDEILDLQFRRGEIYAEALGDLDAALACYDAVLEQEPRNRRALECQERIFFRRLAWQKLYEIYEKLIDVADGDEELGDVYARMARLSSDALDNEEGAIDFWGRVLDIRGEDPQALHALAELYGRREMWDDLVEVIERQVSVEETGEGQIYLYKSLGRVWAEKLGRERNALDAWLAADRLNPYDMETLNALAYLYRSTQSWEELSQTLQRIIEVGQMSETQPLGEDALIELYAQLGQLEGDILQRVNEAVEAWRRVIALDPSDFRALNALEQLFTREARWEETIEVVERRSLVIDDPQQRIDTLLQAAAIWEEKEGNLDASAEVYERVRAADPANVIASERLEAIYRQQYKWDQLNEVLLERVEMREDAQERIDILGAVAKIYEQEMHDQESAFVVLQAAFREDYAHEGTAKELERLATATGKWEELLSDYSEVVSGLESEDPDAACDLWVKIGRWYGDHLSHVDYAIHSVQRALQINPEHLGALGALADFQRKRASWHELIETLGKHAQLESNTEKKVQLYLDLAELLETQLQTDIQAISAYQSALAADETSMEALVALERLYRRHEMWEQLIDVLGRMAALRSDDEEVVRLRLEIGQLWDERMLDAGQAIEAYRVVLIEHPDNVYALRALEQLYEKTGQSEQYLEILEAQLDASPSDAEQIALYERMASAWEERFGKLDRAAECLEKIVALDERNYGAYRELARLYRQDSKWDSLVDTYRNYIMAASDTASRVDLYVAMGDVYERELNDVDRAIEAYTDVLTFDPDEPRALDALGRLYERIEEWERAIDVMSQLVQQAEDPDKQVDLHHRIGRITATKLHDLETAEQYFLRGLTIDSTHVPTMEELVNLYNERGDWQKAAQTMVKAESHTQNVLDKVRLLFDAARLYLERLDQPEQAKEYLAAVIALDPEHVGAGEPLADLYFEAGQWAELSPVLDMLVRKAQQEHNREPRELNELYYRTARCADELGDYDKALQFYRAAYDLDSTYLPTLVARADLLYKMQDWDAAGKIYQTILVQHRDSQDEADVVRIYYRLGMVRQHLGERRKALNMFEKALEIDAHHADTLHAIIDIQQGQGDYEAVVHAKRGLMATADADEHVKLLAEIAEHYHGQLNNPQKAISALLEALDVKNDDHSLLQRVLELYTETEQWKKSVETINRFIELTSKPYIRGSYHQAAGIICRDKLKAHDEAIEYFNNALDAFFEEPEALPQSMRTRALKAFADIDKILTTKRDWKNQERAYRKMIKRLPANDPILKDLWHALGEIYRSRLVHYESAIQAFEIAQKLDPANTHRNEILAELYLVAGPDHADKAVVQHMNMLRAEPFKYDSYKALCKIYMDTHQYDKRWCVCNTLAFLKKADPEEMQFYEQYKPRGFVKAKQRMTEDIWRKVYHPDENRYISAILAAIWQGAASIRAVPHKQLGLRRKDRRQIEDDQLLFSKIFFYVAQVLNVPLPEVYLQDNQPGEILLANCLDKQQLVPSFVVRQNLLQGRPEKEVAFAAGTKLTFMRPEHYLKLALPTNTELKTALLSAIVLVRRDFPVPPDMQANVATYLPEMQKRIAPQVFEQLGIVVNRFLQDAPEVNMAKWGYAVESTAHRVGFIICGDLETAARMVSAEPTVVGGPQAKDKIKELVLYSVSEDYFAVRHHLGLTIG